MPLTAHHKEKSREKILQAASKRFVKQGYEKTSIDEIMQDANMTRGGFYAHFSSKSELYKESIFSMAKNTPLKKAVTKGDQYLTHDCLLTLIDFYLSSDHVQLKAEHCPIASLATDIAVREPDVRSAYTSVFSNMVKIIDEQLPSGPADSLSIMATLVGSVAIARAINDDELAHKLLNSSKKLIHNLITEPAARCEP